MEKIVPGQFLFLVIIDAFINSEYCVGCRLWEMGGGGLYCNLSTLGGGGVVGVKF